MCVFRVSFLFSVLFLCCNIITVQASEVRKSKTSKSVDIPILENVHVHGLLAKNRDGSCGSVKQETIALVEKNLKVKTAVILKIWFSTGTSINKTESVSILGIKYSANINLLTPTNQKKKSRRIVFEWRKSNSNFDITSENISSFNQLAFGRRFKKSNAIRSGQLNNAQISNVAIRTTFLIPTHY
ncbi:MAG: hypothetical protein HRT87_01910 [Legionellales bacterium]|nr:hypothetical protein [Legionellales bacterium]